MVVASIKKLVVGDVGKGFSLIQLSMPFELYTTFKFPH